MRISIPVVLAGIAVYFIMVARFTIYDLIASIIISLIASVIVGDLVAEKPWKIVSPKRICSAIAYILYYLFVIEPRCHLNVAAMILGLKPYKPDIVPVPYSYGTDYAVAAAANSITNTPGTLVVDIDPDERIMHVHWMEAVTKDPVETHRRILRVFDKWIKRIFEG